jgi:hypothetical protein
MLLESVNGRYVRMVEGSKDLRFSLETSQPIGVV